MDNQHKCEINRALTTLLGSDSVIVNAPMKDQTAFRIGGPADFLVMPETADQLIQVIRLCQERNLPYFLMGNGSNLLVKDGGYRGVVIKTRSMDSVIVTGNTIIAESGAMLRKVAHLAMTQGLSGLAFASGIPGTIGGAVVMNAGAYGGEMKHIISAVTLLDSEGHIQEWDNPTCDFGYRHSAIQKNGGIVLRVSLTLTPGDPEQIQAEMTDLNQRRRDKQPLEYPSAGSTFKRPEGHFAGKLIQDCGLKGYRSGGAMVSEKHAGFVINTGDATAQDVSAVIQHVQTEVFKAFGVVLDPEVILVGED